MFLIEEKLISSCGEYRHLLACYDVYFAAADAALETSMATIRSTTATAAGRAHASDVREFTTLPFGHITHKAAPCFVIEEI
jgi:hypothetical protein